MTADDPKTEVLAHRDGAALIAQAIDKGSDVATLERLFELQKRWEANEAKKAFVAAMARFKSACPSVLPKDAEVSHRGGQYRHATLGAILARVTPHLSAEGLSVGWQCEQPEGLVRVTCTVTHDMGHSESSWLTAPRDDSGSKNPIQSVGSTVTYLSRYTLQAALGLATADDDDGMASGAPIGNGGQKQAPKHNGNGKNEPATDAQRERLVEYSQHPAIKGGARGWCARKAADERLTKGQAGEGIGKYKPLVEKWEAEHGQPDDPPVDPETGEVGDTDEGPPPLDDSDREPGSDDDRYE